MVLGSHLAFCLRRTWKHDIARPVEVEEASIEAEAVVWVTAVLTEIRAHIRPGPLAPATILQTGIMVATAVTAVTTIKRFHPRSMVVLDTILHDRMPGTAQLVGAALKVTTTIHQTTEDLVAEGSQHHEARRVSRLMVNVDMMIRTGLTVGMAGMGNMALIVHRVHLRGATGTTGWVVAAHHQAEVAGADRKLIITIGYIIYFVRLRILHGNIVHVHGGDMSVRSACQHGKGEKVG